MVVTVVSGASRGIGKAIADDLRPDMKVIGICSKRCNMEEYDSVYHYIDQYYELFQEAEQINLVLCAAQIGTASNMGLKEMDKLYRINVIGNLAIIKHCMLFYQKMNIVWFAGGGAAYAFPEFVGYSLSKTAVVRAVENLSLILPQYNEDTSIIALAPGAVETDMLKKVVEANCEVRTRTDISEPVNFVRKFITNNLDSKLLNGKFVHVRDDLSRLKENPSLFNLRRVE